jgi:hypothetical protein
VLQRWTSPLQGHSISDEIVSRGRIWGWCSALCVQLRTDLIVSAAILSSLTKTAKSGSRPPLGVRFTGQNVVRFRAHFHVERSYPKRSASGARARGPTSIVWPRRPLRARRTARGTLIHPPATSRRGTFEPSRRRLPTRSGEKAGYAWPVGLTNVPQKHRGVQQRAPRRRTRPSKRGRFLAASQGCARRAAGAQKLWRGA